ncbi:alpha/beta hydrolase family protein [Pseudonocardia sp. TRM90224]|uniref:alpha/beta hydrolase family protein n=1 Tax=Pseudonocardia sp. TRM90224 TaxID=2812678 RepID=UPI001E477045|nr:alpha/beta hydrolase [Pseudonocardia sp. TRM90224]
MLIKMLALALATVAATTLPAAAAVSMPEPAQGRTVELTVTTNDGQHLPATLHVPPGVRAGAPGVVLVHGAGPGAREYYEREATAFARAGIATLTYDKRTVGYSLTERSYSQLADDALAAADVLRTRPEVDPAKVGLWGLSEGGWVAPLAASREPRTAFLVVIGANGMPPLRQHSWAERVKAEHAGIRGSMVTAYSRTFWRLLDAMGLFAEAHHDPTPTLRSLTLPVLGIWGALDRSTAPVENVEAFRLNLDAAGNRHYTLRTVAGAEHQVLQSADGWAKGDEFAPGYVELMTGWVHEAAAGRAPATSIEAAGEQSGATREMRPPSLIESAPVQLGVLGVAVVGLGGFVLASLWRRLRGGRTSWPAYLAAGAGFVAALGAPVYISYLQAVSGGTPTANGTIDPGPLVAGRTLPWLGLQVLAVVAVVAAVVTFARNRPTGRHALLLTGVVAFVAWGVWWGLLLP